MRSTLGVLALVFSTWIAVGQRRAEGLREVLLTKPDQVMVAAHRGSHLNQPENSIASFRAAIDEGVDIIELDVRQSSDGELVVVHDRTVDRTTTGKGEVSEMTLVQLKALVLSHNGQPTEERIPTLKEALESVKGDVLIDIDFKVGDRAAARQCYALIDELGMADQVIFFLYDADWVSECLTMNPDILVMPRVRSAAETKQVIQDVRVRIVHIDDSFYEDELVNALRGQGVRVWANALGDHDREARENGGDFGSFFKQMRFVNVIQTDLPEALVAYLLKQTHPFPGFTQ